MDESRRSFVGALGAVVASLSATMAAVPQSDAFTFAGYQVRWNGWREPANQIAKMGFWSAHKGATEFVYSTTGGAILTAHNLDVLDLTWANADGWPSPHRVAFDDALAASAKERAKIALIERLRA